MKYCPSVPRKGSEQRHQISTSSLRAHPPPTSPRDPMRVARAAADAARRAFAGTRARSPPSQGFLRAASLRWTTLTDKKCYATYAVSAGNGDHGRLGHGPSGSGDNALGLSSERFQRVRLSADVRAVAAGEIGRAHV